MKVLLLTCVATGLMAQGLPSPGNRGPQISQALVGYLQLTSEQVTAINRFNAELRAFQAEKAMRAAQVRLEIAQEMRKETLDAMALGLRYVEIEAIRRETDARANETTRQVQAQLTPAQRTRLEALQEILRNYGLACEAVAHRLLSTSGATTGAISAVPVYGIGCAIPAFRSGDMVITPMTEPTVSEP